MIVLLSLSYGHHASVDVFGTLTTKIMYFQSLISFDKSKYYTKYFNQILLYFEIIVNRQMFVITCNH